MGLNQFSALTTLPLCFEVAPDMNTVMQKNCKYKHGENIMHNGKPHNLNLIKTQHSTVFDNSVVGQRRAWPRGYKILLVLNSAEHEICPANKSRITNNCKFFLAKHS